MPYDIIPRFKMEMIPDIEHGCRVWRWNLINIEDNLAVQSGQEDFLSDAMKKMQDAYFYQLSLV